jgi:hypothetical protein
VAAVYDAFNGFATPRARDIEYSRRYDASMSANTNGFAAPRARDIEHTRRAKVAPLLAAGMSVRAIAAETRISVGAVHRAKQQLEKAVAQGKQQAAAIAQQLPASYLMKQDVGGVPQDVRKLTVSVYERAVESAIGRGLLDRPRRRFDDWQQRW